MKTPLRRPHLIRGILLAGLTCTSAAALAEDPSPKQEPGWWDRSKAALDRTWKEGRQELYLMGYSYHGRSTYSKEKIEDFTEAAWGIGYGRSLTAESGNDHSIYAMMFLDSHSDPQPLVGYSYQWVWGGTSGLRAGLGLTAGITARADFSWIPFPIILPVASIGTRDVALMASYIPPNPANTAGNVLFLFGKINLDWGLKK